MVSRFGRWTTASALAVVLSGCMLCDRYCDRQRDRCQQFYCPPGCTPSNVPANWCPPGTTASYPQPVSHYPQPVHCP